MRKLGFLYCLFIVSSFSVFAQSVFRLEFSPIVKDSVLVIDLLINKEKGNDFTLGASNFDFLAKSSGIDISKTKFVSGEFDASNDAASYLPMGTGKNQFFAFNIRPNVNGAGKGKIVSDSKTKIGSVEIPITNPCATASAEWVIGGAAIHSYFKSAKGKEISKDGVYINSNPIDLDGGVSKTIPTITMSKGKLLSSSAINNQWYLDGTLIPGANSQEITPLIQGKYTVEVTYPCAKNFSEVMPVLITGLADFTLSSGFSVQPNPFVGETFIQYSLANPASIKLELYDLSGTHILDLESGFKPQGKHEFVFKPNFYNLSAGAYVAKLTIGDKMGTIKLVALK
jgi:hypothetical protein